ncbi:CAP domain-containing protein [Glycomyces tenuis]|uniref:CAP domain-containing protein n=1 Tax=Glycomyces tenuis TaxID=58116 RepID=UPI000686C5A9|nr:CAP domain-containing protein [Glycomyces tenuis]
MSRPRGGLHRDPAESRRRTFLVILLACGLGAAATSLWALDSPLGETTASGDGETAAEVAETPDGAPPELQIGDSAVQPQAAEEEPTSAAPTDDEPSSESEPDEDDDEPEPDPDRTTEEALVAAVNSERAEAGCGAVESNATLDTTARLHAEDMGNNDYFSHTSLDGRSPSDRAAEQGYSGGVGENIAAGHRDVSEVMEAWMNSEGHRANILNCDYDVIGVGVAEVEGSAYTMYWVQNFG